VHLYIFAGFFAPAWATSGAVTDTFTVPYGPVSGQLLLPMPWDQVYLGHWFDFLKLVSQRYGNHPSFLMIGAAGPTSVSEEFTEPIDRPSIVKWMYHGYTSTRYLAAWQQTFQTYAKLFPNQYVSLSHGHGVPISAGGAYSPDEPARTVPMLVGEGLSTLGAQFVYQSSALRGYAYHEDAFHSVLDYNGSCPTGFLLSTSCETAAAAMGAAGNPPLALQLTIQRGMQVNSITGKHADYIEVHAIDVDSADLQPVLRWGASLFP
jgi:hypothetical protein